MYGQVAGMDLNTVFEPIWRAPFKTISPSLRTAALTLPTGIIH
jgi:hypothetical protein